MIKLRDPLYGQIVVDEVGSALIDTPAFQRLGRIKQLSLVSVLHRSAMHTRFEHSVGVYHIARSILRDLREAGLLEGISKEDQRLVSWACLVHDAGHYVAAHSLEELGYPGARHEEAGERWFTTGELGEIFAATGIPDAGARVAELVQGKSSHPLAGIVSGACDADKLDYLVRDADRCGLAPGFDQTHLRSSLLLVQNPVTGAQEIGLDEDGLVSFEQMLLAKNMLYRNAYFHPVVRSATVMQRALIVEALDAGLLGMDELREWSDEEVTTLLRVRIARRRKETAPTRLVETLVNRLSNRQLYKPINYLPLSVAPDLGADQIRQTENELAARLGLDQGEVLLDISRKPSMLSTDILVRLSGGEVVPASELGPEHGFAMNRAKDSFYAAAGRILLFAARAPERRALSDAELAEVLHGAELLAAR
jgi:HD superfamily phosphohydrolase